MRCIGEATSPVLLDRRVERRIGSSASFCAPTSSVEYGELMRTMNLLRAAGYLKVALVGLDAQTGQ